MENKKANQNDKPKYETPLSLRLENMQTARGICMNVGSSAMMMPGCITGNIAGNDCQDGNSPDVDCNSGSSVN
jgi:hypothetical protein